MFFIVVAAVCGFVLPVFAFFWGVWVGVKRPKCAHDWKLMDRHVEPSPMDKARKDGFSIDHTGPAGIAERMNRGRYVCIMACTKCGTIDKTVEEV